MEHIAFELGKDPLEIRLRNMSDKYPILNNMISISATTSKYKERKENIELFNEVNSRVSTMPFF